MAIVIGTSTTARSTTSVSSLTFAHDATGADMLIVGAGDRAAMSTCTYNGVSMTLLTGANQASANARFAYLANPPAGSFNVVVTFSTSNYAAAGAVNVSGTDGTVGTVANTTSASVGNITGANVTSGVGTVIIDYVSHGVGANLLTPVSPQTQIFQDSFANTYAMSYQAGSASTLHNDWTNSGGASVMASTSVAINPSAGGAPYNPTPLLSLMGVGS